MVQSNSSRRRRLIVDDEDSPQATPSGNDTSSKLQAVQFELPLTATRAVVHEDSPQPSPSMSTALIAPPPELMQQSDEVALIQIRHDSLITDYPFTNSNAISIIKEEGSTEELGMMVRDYLTSEEDNARGNFEHIFYSIQLFTESRWSFNDFFIGFEEMVMTVRKNLLEDTPPIQDSMVVAIKKVVIAKNREGRIAANDLEINNSYIRARQFIKNFSSQIFELFQAFHNCKDNPSDLPLSITKLFPLVTITKDEMSHLISMLGASIGQITAEDRLLINLSGKGFLKLREELYRHLTESLDVARCVHDNDKENCIKIVEEFITNEIGQKFSFSKKNSERLWKFLGEFCQSTFPKSFKQSALSVQESCVIESPSTPLNLSTLSKSINEVGSSSLTLATDSKKRKERDFDTHLDSSASIAYVLRSRKDSSGGNSAGNLDADMKKLIEAREKARVKAANARRAAKARAKALTEKKVVVVEKRRENATKKKKKKKKMKQKAKKNMEMKAKKKKKKMKQKAKKKMEMKAKMALKEEKVQGETKQNRWRE